MYYAQLNSQNIVLAVTETSGEINAANMVLINSFDASLLGSTYVNGGFVKPPAPPEIRHITVGSFFDRFGDQKWPILADTNASVQALIKDASVRAYINLDDPQVRTGLEMVVSAGHNIDPTAIITAPIQPEERP
jgi:hypothetical protein